MKQIFKQIYGFGVKEPQPAREQTKVHLKKKQYAEPRLRREGTNYNDGTLDDLTEPVRRKTSPLMQMSHKKKLLQNDSDIGKSYLLKLTASCEICRRVLGC